MQIQGGLMGFLFVGFLGLGGGVLILFIILYVLFLSLKPVYKGEPLRNRLNRLLWMVGLAVVFILAFIIYGLWPIKS